MHLNHSLKDLLLLIHISCSMALVQPNSLLSNMNTLWKAKTNSLATAAFLGDQWASPSRFNFSSSFSCLAMTDMGSGLASEPRVASISSDNSVGDFHCTPWGEDRYAPPTGKQLHHGPGHREMVYLTFLDDTDYSANRTGPYDQGDPTAKLIGYHEKHNTLIIPGNLPYLHVQDNEPKQTCVFST